jgi:hypothetical protein
MEYTLRDGIEPNPNDVLCGRGAGTNNNKGNSNWRKLVALNKQLYTTLAKKHKMCLSKYIVSAVRTQDPAGRFLQKDTNSDTWYDIGDERAQQKTSQALREPLRNSTSQLASDASSQPSQSSLVAPSSRLPATIPIPGNGENPHLMAGFPTQISMQMASETNTAIDVNAVPCPNMMMLPNDMTDYPEAPTHQGDNQDMLPMVMNKNAVMVPTQAVCSRALPPPSAPQGPVLEGRITLTERQLADLGGGFSSRSLMSLLSCTHPWQPDGDPSTVMPVTVSYPVQAGEHRRARSEQPDMVFFR